MTDGRTGNVGGGEVGGKDMKREERRPRGVGGGQGTEDRGRRAGTGGQGTEDRVQWRGEGPEDRGRRIEDSGEVRDRRTGDGG